MRKSSVSATTKPIPGVALSHKRAKGQNAPTVFHRPASDARLTDNSAGVRHPSQPLPLSETHTAGRFRFGHDFSQVRVQADSIPGRLTPVSDAPYQNSAPEHTRANAALNAPSTILVSHLGGVQLQREPMDVAPSQPRSREGLPMRRGSTLPYREATQLLECIRIMGEESRDYCREQVLVEGVGLGGSPAAAPAPPPPAFVPCDPNRALTWADFTGSPSGTTSAFTGYDFPTASTPSGTRIRAVFDPARSFVLPQFGNPTDSSLNGCDANIAQCQTFFPPGSTGGSFALNSAPSATCPAAARANPAVVASSITDCTGIIATECQRVAQDESDRLLRHEQLHFDIACVLAGKANAALAAGTALATVQTALTTQDTQTTNSYDTQTRRGCLAAQQATWQTNVAAGLTAVTIP